MNTKRLLLWAGIAGLTYTAYRVWRLTGAHVTTDANSATVPFGEALRSQTSAVTVGYGLAVVYALATR